MSRPKITHECRRAILEHAEPLLHLQGFHGTSLDEIARRCRMTKANLIHHFGSKENLALAVLDFKIAKTVDCCVAPLFRSGTDPAAAIKALFAQARKFHSDNGCRAGCYIGNAALEMSDFNEKFRQRAAGFFEIWIQHLERLFLEKGSAKPRDLAEAVISLYEGAIMLARTSKDPDIFERLGLVAASLANAPSNLKRKMHSRGGV